MEKIDEVIFYSLEKALKMYRQFAQKQINEKSIDITIDQWLLLCTIKENKDISQQEIAEKIFKDLASVTRIIELLVKKGFLAREIHKNDRRRFALSITTKGHETIKIITPIVINYRKRALKDINSTDIEKTKGFLKKIINNCK